MQRNRAQALAETAISLFVMFAIGALSIYGGVLALTALELQSSVMASALAAEQAVKGGTDPETAARTYAAMNPTISGPVTIEVAEENGALVVRGTVTCALPFGLWVSAVPLTRTVTLAMPSGS